MSSDLRYCLCFPCELLTGLEWRRSVFGFRSLLMFKAWSFEHKPHDHLLFCVEYVQKELCLLLNPASVVLLFCSIDCVREMLSVVEVKPCRFPICSNKPFGSLQRTFSSASLIMYWVCSKNLWDERNIAKAAMAIYLLFECTYLRTQGNHLLLYCYHISW